MFTWPVEIELFEYRSVPIVQRGHLLMTLLCGFIDVNKRWRLVVVFFLVFGNYQFVNVRDSSKYIQRKVFEKTPKIGWLKYQRWFLRLFRCCRFLSHSADYLTNGREKSHLNFRAISLALGITN